MALQHRHTADATWSCGCHGLCKCSAKAVLAPASRLSVAKRQASPSKSCGVALAGMMQCTCNCTGGSSMLSVPSVVCVRLCVW
jgi:hypothetical protein